MGPKKKTEVEYLRGFLRGPRSGILGKEDLQARDQLVGRNLGEGAMPDKKVTRKLHL
jgi:hypothetical protein